MADSRFSVQVRLIAGEAHATNSAYQYTGDWDLRQYGAEMNLKSSFLRPQKNSRPRLFSTGLQLLGPGVLVRLSPQHTLAVSSRVRSALQGSAISRGILEQAVDGFSTWGRSANNSFNLSLNAFAEWNIS